MAAEIEGVGQDAPTVTNDKGAKQSDSPYRADLLMMRAVLDVCAVLKRGAVKYGDNNWRGLKIEDHLNHALVHIFAYLAGDRQDAHLTNAACRSLMALETQLTNDQAK